MSRTYNAFGKNGTVVEDPPYLIWLQKHPDNKFGMYVGDVTPREAAEWMLMSVEQVPFGAVRGKVEDEEPTICFHTVEKDETKLYNPDTGEQIDILTEDCQQ